MSKRDQEKAFEAAKRVAEEAIRTVDKHDGVQTLHKYATKKLFIALIIAAVIGYDRIRDQWDCECNSLG